MAIADVTQALVAAFSFGIVVNAASAAGFLFVKGHGSSLFRDGPRLVLVTFLLSAALWGQIDFVTIILDPRGTTACQVGIAFAAFFDQLGRFAVEQYLFWALAAGQRPSVAKLIPQGLILVRFVLGCVFVGFSRQQKTAAVCLPRSEVVALSAAVIILDGVIIIALAGQAIGAGILKEARQGGGRAARARSILATHLGFFIWLSTSIPLSVGLETINMVFRTAFPAGGLTVLIVIVTACQSHLLTSKTIAGPVSDATSPRNIETSRSISTSDSSEGYPPTRYEDLKAVGGGVLVREARIQGQQTQLPRIARPITGVQGMGGVPLQGALFPPPQSVQEAPLERPVQGNAPMVVSQDQQKSQIRGGKSKRNIFDYSKSGPAGNITVGRMNISNPVLLDDADKNPLNKIPTIGLQEAAIAERARRQAYARQSGLIAQRPAPLPPGMSSHEDSLRKSVSLKRKEVARNDALSVGMIMPDASRPQSQSQLMSVPVATTTSSQLSPGVEDVRRRSPRTTSSMYQAPINPLGAQPVASKRMTRKSMPPPLPLVPRETPVPLVQPAVPVKQTAQPAPATAAPALRTMPSIRPSRQLPPSPKTPPAEPTKTPLQRAPTAGLPNNPRSQALRKLDQEASSQRQQTVLFVNNITYNDPTTVQSIMMQGQKGGKEIMSETPGTGKSVMARPRPVPRNRDTSEERGIFPAQQSPRHRRSKSGGSMIGNRKSLLQSSPGSPTDLPPLPPPPKSAGPDMAARAQPNNTKSMTVGEKMDIFFPIPSGAQAQEQRNNLPVLNVPGSRTSFLKSASLPSEKDRESRPAKRETQNTVETSILNASQIIPPSLVPGYLVPERYRNLADELSDSWLPAPAPVTATSVVSPDTRKRASSPILPVDDNTSWRQSSEGKTQTEVQSNWGGTVYSPVEAVNMSVIRQAPRETYIQKSSDRLGLTASAAGSHSRTISAATQQSRIGSEVMTVMLDNSPAFGGPGWQSPFTPAMLEQTEAQKEWHRRVGDDCPTFSDRKEENRRSRKMPPPTPLLLGANKGPSVVVHAEPSPESPDHALHQIQQQLRNLDGPLQSGGSGRGQRIALLENLEAEMGAQENRWLEMQNDLGRDSISTLGTAPSPAAPINKDLEPVLERDLSREASLKSNLSERRASRRAMLAKRNTPPKLTKALPPQPAQEQVPRSSIWQQRLVDAQVEFLGKAGSPLTNNNGNMSLLNVSLSQADLGSPTPPESDLELSEESEVEIPAVKGPRRIDEVSYKQERAPMGMRRMVQQLRAKTLWTAPQAAEEKPVGLLWTAAKKPPKQVELLSVSAATHPPMQRKRIEPSSVLPKIESLDLWSKELRSSKRKSTVSSTGLWQPVTRTRASSALSTVSQRNSQKPARPLTVRPPRRTRRVTALPDIVEDPQPLPDRRGTLGIFQFPWGERSDTASIMPQYRAPPTFMAMPGTMTSSRGGNRGMLNAALDARARELAAEEYEGSFFDEYDDEEGEGDSDYDEDGEGEDDEEVDFDESTLWEIASLLKTDKQAVTLDTTETDGLAAPAEVRNRTGSVVDAYLLEDLAEEQEEEHPARQAKAGKTASMASMASTQSIIVGMDGFPLAPYEGARLAAPVAITIERASRSDDNDDDEAAELALTPSPSEEMVAMVLDNNAHAPQARIPTLWNPAPPRTDPASTSDAGMWNASRRSAQVSASADHAVSGHDAPRRSKSQTSHAIEQLTSSQLWATPVAKAPERHWATAHLLASIPGRRYSHRKIGTPEQWATELASAVAASHAAVDKQSFNPATTHPVFATSSHASNSDHFHPAATGYTYSVSEIHPVFFGSMELTCPAEVAHPAIASYFGTDSRRTSTYADDVVLLPATTYTSIVDKEAGGEGAVMLSQIEALEQERMFVEEAVRAHFRRLSQHVPAGLPIAEERISETSQAEADLAKLLNAEKPTHRPSQLFSPAPESVASPTSNYDSSEQAAPVTPAGTKGARSLWGWATGSRKPAEPTTSTPIPANDPVEEQITLASKVLENEKAPAQAAGSGVVFRY